MVDIANTHNSHADLLFFDTMVNKRSNFFLKKFMIKEYSPTAHLIR